MLQATDHSDWIYARGPYDEKPSYRLFQETYHAWKNVTLKVSQATQEDVLRKLVLDRWYIFVIPNNPVKGEADIQTIFRHVQ